MLLCIIIVRVLFVVYRVYQFLLEGNKLCVKLIFVSNILARVVAVKKKGGGGNLWFNDFCAKWLGVCFQPDIIFCG